MSVIYALTGAGIVACAIFMILSRNLVRMLLGFSLLATGVNMLLFLAGGLGTSQPPIIRDGAKALEEGADPIIQALILTAIVIGFALTVVFGILILKVWRAKDTIKSDQGDAAQGLGQAQTNDPADG